MASISTGVFKKVALKRQVSQGAIAAAGAAGSARYVRRTTSTLDLAKASYQSAEMLASQQKRDMRHGVRSVAGSISGELSVGGYQLPIESVLRQNSVNPTTTGAIATITAAATAGNGNGTFTRSAGSFLADGFLIGDVVTAAGFAVALDNNAHYAIITSLTATVMTVHFLDNRAMVARAAGDNVTISTVGKKTFIPAANQSRDYYTIEHWFGDVGQSERFVDSVFTGFNVALPPSGMATIEFPVMGLDMQTGNAQYFTNPADAPTGGILAAVNGALMIDGALAAYVTGLTLAVTGNYSVPGGVVGANVDPDVFPGSVDVTGQITVLFVDATFRDKFINETESQIAVALTAGSAPNAGFTAFNLPRVKYSGATKDDTNAGLTLTMPFTALENTVTGTGLLPSTIGVQDSAFV